jgi:hypothetical protein
MFTNTVSLCSTSSIVPTSIIDGPTNRRTLRRSADGKIEFSIAHNESNENPGFVTQRSNVRISKEFVLGDTDKSVRAYVQLTSSIPQGVDEVTAAAVQALIGKLLSFLVNSENGGNLTVVTDGDLGAVPRLLAGEP